MTIELKVCNKCHLEQPIANFAVTNKAKGWRRGFCRSCDAVRVRAYYAANPDYRAKTKANSEKWRRQNPERFAVIRRRNMLKTKYALSHEEFDQLFLSQGKGCALCGASEHGRQAKRDTPENGERAWLTESWPVDHCHKSGQVRGLLCHACNTQLGSYETLLERVGAVRLLDYLGGFDDPPGKTPPIQWLPLQHRTGAERPTNSG